MWAAPTPAASPAVQLGEAKAGAPPHDTVTSISPPSASITGTLVYTQWAEQDYRNYLTIRRVAENAESPVTSYSLNATPYAFSPQFSPDGRFVLFRAGQMGDRFDLHHIYFWDRLKQRTFQGPSYGLFYLRAFWSANSRYVAYVTGGDIEGNANWNGNLDDSLGVYIYDIWTRKSHFVVQSPTVTRVGWTAQGPLLYSAFSRTAKIQRKRKILAQELKRRPDVYEVPAAGGNAKLVLRDGYRPVPSPDGQWIACFTSTNPQQKARPLDRFYPLAPSQAFLCLYSRAERKRYIVRPAGDQFGELRWTPDSKQLVALKLTLRQPNTAQFELIDVATRQARSLTTLETHDKSAGSRVETQPTFNALGVSKDGQSLFVITSEVEAEPSGVSGNATIVNTLHTVNRRSGEIATVVRSVGDNGMDWHDETKGTS